MDTTPQPWRRLVGMPWKQLQATLILEKEIKKKNTDDVESSKSIKKKGMKYLHKLICLVSLAFNLCNNEKTSQFH
jgi:hypothetical protein